MDKKLDPFILEGRVIHWPHRGQPKCILLATTQGEVIVKLSKDLRRHFLWQPQPLAGTWMRFAGEVKKNGEYKAEYFDWLDRPAPEKIESPTSLPIALPSGLAAALPTATPTNSRIFSPPAPVALSQSPSISTPAANSVKAATGSKPPACILVCGKSSCQKRGAGAVIASLEEAVVDRGLASQVKIKTTGCLKKCKQGANVLFLPDKTSYTAVKPVQVSSLLTKHFPPKSHPSEQFSEQISRY